MLKFCLVAAGSAITLPVTPKSYSVSRGMGFEVVNIHELGDYPMPTEETLQSIKLECFLPSSSRSYCVAYADQETLLRWMEAQISGRARLRFLITGTRVNVPVYLETIEYGEQDGTGDLYVTLTLREYRTLAASAVQAGSSAKAASARAVTAQQKALRTYVVKSGDTLWSICKQFYGDGSLCYKLAAYNGIKNANLIRVGQVLKIPDAATLGATAATQSSIFSRSSSSSASSSASSSTSTEKRATTTTSGYALAAARYTLTIYYTGLVTGYATYSYFNNDTGKRVYGQIKSGMTITAISGTAVAIQWRSQAGCYVEHVFLDGSSRATTGGKTTIYLDKSHQFTLRWAR